MRGDAAFRYRAFLSYSHNDEAAAGKLHRALESYVLPRRVRKAHGLPRRLIPIFRDVEELAAASGLTTRLQDALDQSQWLIVSCSPTAAQSKYVNQEIEYFLGKHGANRVLCALVGGEPPECFPPAIRKLAEEPLAADFRPGKDFELSKLKLIAALAGIGFTELRNREAQRRKRQQLLVASIAAGLALGTLAWWDLFQREQSSFYTNYTKVYGIWRGVDPISAKAASQRAVSYRFTRQGRLRPPRRVDYVNGSGFCPRGGMDGPLGHPPDKGFGMQRTRYCAIRFDYGEGGALTRETWLSMADQTLDSLAHTEQGLAQFTQRGFAAAEGASGVFYIQATRDDQGYDRRVQFLHSLDNPRMNGRREFGWALDYDTAGRVARRSTLDDAGKDVGPVTHTTYDAAGLIVRTRITGVSGDEQVGVKGFSTRAAAYDAQGNLQRESFFLPDGQPALATAETVDGFETSGFVAQEYSWDERGNNTEYRQYDAQGKLVNNRLGFAVVRVRHDARGNITRLESLDADLRPATIAGEGVPIAEFKFDDAGNPVEDRSFNADGRLMARSWGPAIIRRSIDERSLQECMFDEADRAMTVVYGHCYRWLLDARGNPAGIDFIGVDGKPFLRPDSGVARVMIRRDDRGNIIGQDSFGADLTPIINRRTGAASGEHVLDEYGNQVESRRYDTQRRLMRGAEGYAIVRARFDRSGNRIDEAYFDERQRPTRHRDGYFGYRVSFDNLGRPTRREFLDERGALMAVMGHYGVEYARDAFGSLAKETYLNAAGQPAARTEFIHNALGLEIERRHYDAAGAPAPHPRSGCATETHVHDHYSRVVEQRCLSVAGKPVNRLDGGWAVKKISPQFSGVNEESYFDAAGKPVKPKA